MPSKIRVVSGCAGYDTADQPAWLRNFCLSSYPTDCLQCSLNLWHCQALALHYLSVPFETAHVTEQCPQVATLLRCTHRFIQSSLTDNNISRDMNERPDVTYIGTSPCGDFSAAGDGAGVNMHAAVTLWLLSVSHSINQTITTRAPGCAGQNGKLTEMPRATDSSLTLFSLQFAVVLGF